MTNLSYNDRGTLVQYLQLALTRAGYPTNTDGIFGDRTCASLRAFMPELSEGCIVDDDVWLRLVPFLKGYTTHQIAGGDTIWNIAARYGSNVPAILAANPKVNPIDLKVATTLYVPYTFSLVADNVNYSSLLNDFIIEGLMVRYPFLMQGELGRSVMGKPLTYLRIGVGEKEVFYNAAFHANEWITTPVLLRFAEEYARAFATGRTLYTVDTAELFYGFSLYLLPMVNPDGVDLVTGLLNEGSYYEQAKRIAADYPSIPFPSGWKANIDGVDLNPQFPAGWEIARQIKFANGYVSPAPRDYVGETPLSARESSAVYDFTRAHNFELILAYHTQGEVIYWKYPDYEPKRALEIALHFGEVSGYTVEETPSESGYAGYKDWFIRTYNRPGYTIEAGFGVNPLPMSLFPKIYQDNHLILEGGMTELVD